MSALTTFDFQAQPVRVLTRDGAPWFVAVDVCRVLDLSNSRDAVAALDEDERLTVGNADGRNPNVATTDIRIPNRGLQVISESGLYALVFRSRKAEAKAFRRWVTAEVLPQIRTTGGYVPPPPAYEGCLPAERMSVLEFVRERLLGWPLQRRIEFGATVRRYAKAMGIVHEVEDHALAGRVFTLPLAVLEEVRREFARTHRVPDADVMEFERLLEAAAVGVGEGGWVATEVLLGVAKTLGMFRRFLRECSSLASERVAFGRVLARFNGHTFPSGWRLEACRTNTARGYRLSRQRPQSTRSLCAEFSLS